MKKHTLLALLLLTPAVAAQEAGRIQTRLLYSFEDGKDVARLLKQAENATLVTVQDNGVTQGSNCARLTVPRGVGYGSLRFDAETIKSWRDFDYFAIDVYCDDDHPYRLVFELWDGLTKNYATRCTYEDVKTRRGRQTLLYPINRARRNGKEGRSWEELEPQDKINLNGLTQVKLFLTPLKDRDAVLWIDNLRLLQEDAAKPKLAVPLPAGAIAFNFGTAGSTAPGFQTIAPQTRFDEKTGVGFLSKEQTAGGEGWPDLLAGTFVIAPEGKPLEFRASVPDGDYRLWLCAGPVLRAQPNDRRFLLRVNDAVIEDATPAPEAYFSEKYLYRFLHTTYSQKPHALWERYIDRMYPVHTPKLTVRGGVVTVSAVNYFLSALVLVPAAAPFEAFAEKTRQLRIAAFEQTLRPLPPKKPRSGAGAYLAYVPGATQTIQPWTTPSAEEQKRREWKTAAAPGQRVVLRLAVVPSEDLGRCTLELADLKGPAVIPSSQIAGHFQNYRWNGDTFGEMALLPSLTLDMESGLSQCFWLWLHVPEKTPAGVYRGSFTFRPGKGEPTVLPVELEVYPFTLEPVLPVSYGMYYHRRTEAGLPDELQRRLLKEQFGWMRQVGFTAVTVEAPTVVGLGKNNEVKLRFDSTLYELAREVGMARHPRQELMTSALGIGRAIGRRLPGSQGAAVDRNPGIELKQPEFRGYYLNALKQYRDFLEKTGLPVAVEIVDEPRETPNPWNRNLADTLTYAGMLREAGLRTFVTPMGDTNGCKDYTVLADHADIISVHAWKASEGLMKRTRQSNRTLWFYNTGMDRFSWGFYNWRAGSAGRWEWHFCFAEDQAMGGYPGRDWYNPFTASHGAAPYAPASYPGGMLYQSRFLDVAEGINDYSYLFTLEQALAANEKAGTNAAAVKEARAFLAALRRVIPDIPGTKGLATAEDGALVGLGIDDEARHLTPQWRARIAEFLKVLRK
jgi:hypothetical protein